jgi:DNA transposition AAA+ family ATPase
MNNDGQGTFLETREYRRFAEFCDTCRRHRYIGLCHGVPGVGKTLSAWHYAQWQHVQPYFPERFYDRRHLTYIERVIADTVAAIGAPLPPALRACRCVLYTPSVTNTPKRVEQEIRALRLALSYLVDASLNPPTPEPVSATAAEAWPALMPLRDVADVTELLIVDEADRLKTAALEQIRDIYDHGTIGIILIGMPGIEKRLSRYPQLYSRVGFVHEFRSLTAEESRLYLAQQWSTWGLTLRPGSATEEEAVAGIIRITQGNFRLLHRLLAQIARQQLVIGAA